MKYAYVLFVLFMTPSIQASVICEGTGKTGTQSKYILSDVKGKTIKIESFINFRGKFEPIINNIAILVAEDKGIFGKDNIMARSYVLPDNDNSYAILFLIYADGTAAFTARPMAGTANFVELKCKLNYNKENE